MIELKLISKTHYKVNFLLNTKINLAIIDDEYKSMYEFYNKLMSNLLIEAVKFNQIAIKPFRYRYNHSDNNIAFRDEHFFHFFFILIINWITQQRQDF